MTLRFRVTAKARLDILGITRYTKRTWGKAASDRYARAIDRRIRWLAEDPRRGQSRDEIAPGYRSYPQGAHLVFFAGGEMVVIGVPHQAMDLHAHFEGDDPE